MCQHRPIFPGRLQPSIFGTCELNFRVRNGNGWTLTVNDTDYSFLGVTTYCINSTSFLSLLSLLIIDKEEILVSKPFFSCFFVQVFAAFVHTFALFLHIFAAFRYAISSNLRALHSSRRFPLDRIVSPTFGRLASNHFNSFRFLWLGTK